MELLLLLAVLVAATYWYRSLAARKEHKAVRAFDAGQAPTLPHAEARTDSQEWVRPFVVYYTAREMQTSTGGALPDQVRALMSGQVDGHQEQSLLAAIGMYLSFVHKRARRAGDYELVVSEARRFLRAEVQTLSNPVATRRFLRRTYQREQGMEIAEAELDRQFKEIADDVRGNDQAGFKLRSILLKDSMNEMFVGHHGKELLAFSKDMAADFDAAV
jgi:hypothetical protein